MLTADSQVFGHKRADLWRLADEFSTPLRRFTRRHSARGRPLGQQAVGIDFDAYQPYRPGDDIKHVDWGVFARNRQLAVRRYQDDTSGLLLLLLDCSGSMAIGVPSKWSLGASLSMVLSIAALRDLHEVVIGVAGASRLDLLPPQHGPDAAQSIIQYLAQRQPAGRAPLSTALERIAERYPKAAVLVMSDFLDDSAPERALSLFHPLVGRGSLIRISAPGEFDPPAAGRYAVDPEDPSLSGHVFNDVDGRLFTERVRDYRDRSGRTAERLGLPLLDLEADLALSDALGAITEHLAHGLG